MTDKQIIEAMAEIDNAWFSSITVIQNRLGPPDYLNDHNAVQRVIDTLQFSSNEQCELAEYARILDMMFPWFGFHKATPRQKCIVILKAKGRIKDNG